MPELTTADLEQYTGERLSADDDETARLLAASLALVRTYCGWHVTPVAAEDEVVIDGPGAALLVLPTRNMTALHSLTEDGDAVDTAGMEWSTHGIVVKANGGRWTTRRRGVTATITHGFEEAPDWQAVVLAVADRSSLQVGGTLRAVGPFQYSDTAADFTEAELSVLDRYRIVDL